MRPNIELSFVGNKVNIQAPRSKDIRGISSLLAGLANANGDMFTADAISAASIAFYSRHENRRVMLNPV